MYFLFALTYLSILAKAHFQLQFPPPRGPFVQDSEVNFCDGYLTTGNRTEFPLSGGFYIINSEHTQWTIGAYIAETNNATNFMNFSLINNLYQEQGEGIVCLPLDFKSSNITNLQNGQNVTIQILFNGPDGMLFQCADLVLSDNYAPNISCKNATSSTSPASPTMIKYVSSIGIAGAVLAVIGLALN